MGNYYEYYEKKKRRDPIRLVDINEAQNILGVGRTTLYELINDGTITRHKIRGRTLFLLNELYQVVKESAEY